MDHRAVEGEGVEHALLAHGEVEVLVGVAAAEVPGQPLDVPVVAHRVGAHRDLLAAVVGALDLVAPFAELGPCLRGAVRQTSLLEDLLVVVEQRRGAALRQPEHLIVVAALLEQRRLVGLRVPLVIEVGVQRLEHLVEEQPMPGGLTEAGQIRDGAGLQGGGDAGVHPVVAIEGLHLDVELLLGLVEQLLLAHQLLTGLAAPRVPHHHPLALGVLLRGVAVDLVEGLAGAAATTAAAAGGEGEQGQRAAGTEEAAAGERTGHAGHGVLLRVRACGIATRTARRG